MARRVVVHVQRGRCNDARPVRDHQTRHGTMREARCKLCLHELTHKTDGITPRGIQPESGKNYLVYGLFLITGGGTNVE